MTSDPALALLGALYAAWETRDVPRIVALFEGNDPDVTYLDASQIDPWIGSAAVERGVAGRCAAHQGFKFKINAPRARSLADDIASVFALVDRGELTNAGVEAERVRVTLVARRRGDAWKICHYAEAPKAPLVELQAFYEAVASDGLESIPPRPWGRP